MSFAKLTCLLLVIPLLFSACKEIKDPVFKHIENVSLDPIKGMDYALKGDLVFHNPNNFGTKIIRTKVNVFYGETYVGKVSQIDKFFIKPNSNFSVPVNLRLNLQEVFTIKGLKDVFGSIADQKVKLNFKGKLVFRVGLFNVKTPVSHTQEVKF